jgi:hypothetical protein
MVKRNKVLVMKKFFYELRVFGLAWDELLKVLAVMIGFVLAISPIAYVIGEFFIFVAESLDTNTAVVVGGFFALLTILTALR